MEDEYETGLEPEDDASDEPATEEITGVVPFVVVGNHEVHDTNPGDTLMLVPSPHTEYLIAAGHILPASADGASEQQ